MKNTKNIISEIKYIIFAIILAFAIKTFLFNFVKVNQSSMFPTLENGDIIIANSLYRWRDNKNRGDIIVFKSPIEKNKLYIKRIIALPGEEITIKNGNIYIDDNLYSEAYFHNKPNTLSEKETWKLSENEYFVLGDNRSPNGSIDSREFGPIGENVIKCKPFFRIFPFNKFGSIYRN
ncbi:signal peptidase I [Peptoniphilus olsenii]|uniref:Signal peptidase I n=1 Tax=Peptoniphilus olsenii TaxID=411570 RepID=A0ABV2J7X1_9FIRM